MHPNSQNIHADNTALIFDELKFRSLTVKNRLFRSNISGQFDDYNGHGGNARLNWEEKFARGGIGCHFLLHAGLSARPDPRALRDDRR